MHTVQAIEYIKINACNDNYDIPVIKYWSSEVLVYTTPNTIMQ